MTVCVLLAALAGPAAGRTIYVDPNGSADFTGIQAAINDANDGDEIEVAAGTYTEAINFIGKAVRLYSSGGSGVTTINGTGYYHVVQCVSGEDANTILEGFTITGGNANGTEPNDRRGGGMFNLNSSPTVIGCVFHRNYTGNGSPGSGDGGDGGDAGHGAGMYNEHSSPSVSNCTFTENITGNGGNGANAEFHLFQDGKRGGEGGNGGTGGGIYNSYSSPTVTECTFYENVAGCGGNGGKGSIGSTSFFGGFIGGNGGNAGHGGYGAGIYNFQSSPLLNNCKFIRNRTGIGGKGGKYGIGGAGITGWSDSGNSGNGGHGGSGAGISNNHSLPTVHRCIINENRTGNGGEGGDGSKKENEYLTLYVQAFVSGSVGGGYAGIGGNSGYGAGIYCFESPATVTDCEFNRNETGYGGFSVNGNGVTGSGGGICSYLSSPVMMNCTFRGNIGLFGGGIYSSYSNPTVTNCTFTKNLGKISGGGLYGSSATVTNCIFWENELNEIAGTEPNVTYCDIEGGYAGTGNINVFPAFADEAGRLSAVSPCIDTGSNSAPNLPDKDFDGNPRITNTTVDMGAFEFTTFRIRNVTKDILYASIQSAIDDADDGDEICVLPGTYFSGIDFKGKAVRLYSTSGPQFTTINGNGAYHAVQCVSGEDANTILEGFTITGGNANGSSAPDNCGGGMLNSGSSPTVLNCVFTGNAAAAGGGMDNENSSPTVTNCSFTSNTASGGGGGMRNAYSSNPTVTNCTFTTNSTDTHGGGLVNVLSSSPKLTNCTFSGNGAGGHGGGMINSVGCSPAITNCTFSSNTAVVDGGGMFNNDNSNPAVTNCNFLYNSAGDGGGMFNNNNSYPFVTNCILWNDTPDEISNSTSSPIVTYCDVNIPSGTYPGTGNINANPGFSGAIIAGRPECSNYLSSSASPCVDAGDNNAPNLPDTDMGGQPRVIDGDVDGNSTVDMGAYELQPCVRNVTRNRWYQLIQHSVEDACENDRIEVPPGTYYESVDFMNAPNNFILTSTDPNDPNIVEQTIINAKFGGHVITFCSQGPSCVLAGFTLTVSGNIMMIPFGYGIGSYGQTTSPTITKCVITNTRGVMFYYGSPVIRGCTIRGNPGGVKLPDNAIIEDCIIANNFGIEGNGLYCAVETGWGNTILRRCVVSGNLCEYAAISCTGDTTIEDCVISDNTGMMGAVWSSGSPSAGKMSRCTITNNEGGGINGWACPIENCIITGNGGGEWAPMSGGGINNCTGPITGCVISGNKALYGGGLGFCNGSIVNCVITDNHGIYGGGLRTCNGTISNCTIVGNVAWDDVFSGPSQGGGLYECSGTISNCIIRQNWAETEGDQLYSCSDPNYSCVQDWTGGGIGNTAEDPNFIQPGYWADANDPNIVVEPNDPNAVWVGGFYRLRRGSPCIDAGDNSSVPGGITTGLSGLPRFIDDLCTFDSGNGTAPVVDMGAYEFLPADIDGSGAVDMRDFRLLASRWQENACGQCDGTDMNCDGVVDFKDVAILAANWLAGTEPEW